MNIGHRSGSLKGYKSLPETQQFAADFPVPAQGRRRVVTTDTFDRWANDNGYYTLRCEQATLLTERNNLRKKINLTASSEAWRALKNIPFSIDVQDHGKSYKIVRAEDSFSIKADKLPGQVRQFTGTKREAVQRLLDSIDIRSLPPAMQMRISALDREMDRYVRGIDYQTMELNREYEAIRLQIKQMIERNQIVAENGGFTALLDDSPEIIQDDDEQDDDEQDDDEQD